MLDFQMFRVRVYPSRQGMLFESPKTQPQILQEAISSLPAAELRKGRTWHIGNVTALDSDGLYFRVGRISRSTMEIYREGVFVDQEFETAPYTHVVMDVPQEVCCIAKKPRLAPTAVGIAKQFTYLLSQSNYARNVGAQFEIDPILDPKDLVDYLERALSVQKFWVTFKRPNPFDAKQDFQQPVQRLLNEIGGIKGKTEFYGEELVAKILANITRAAAATGDDAAATMTLDHQRRVTKRLKGNPVMISNRDIADTRQKQSLLEILRELYRRIRGG
jgi:hypothetical protein